MTTAMFDMMNAVRGEMEAVGGRGDAARFSRWYDARATHPSEIPGGHNGIMTELKTLGGRDSIPDYYLSFAGHNPPLSRGRLGHAGRGAVAAHGVGEVVAAQGHAAGMGGLFRGRDSGGHA